MTQERKFNPDDIQLPTGYHIELFAKGLTAPINMVFTRDWDILVADAGVLDGNGKVMKYTGEDFVVIADGFTPPLKCGMGFPILRADSIVTMPQFRPEGKPRPSFLLAKHPMHPPEPFAVFPPHSAAMGFDFNVHPQFGPVGDAFIAEFGSGAPGTTDRRRLWATRRHVRGRYGDCHRWI